MLFIRLSMGFFDQSQFRYFLKNYIYFIILIFIVIYINLYIDKKAKSTNVVNYNRLILYCFIAFLTLFISDILVSEQKLLNKFIYILLFSILSVFISNYVIVNYFYDGFWWGSLYSSISCVCIIALFGFSFWYSIENKGKSLSDPVFLQFNYASYINQSFSKFSMGFFPLLGVLFYMFNFNNAFGRWASQNILGLMTIVYILSIGFNYAIKIRLINKKQILTTSIVMISLWYLFFILSNYFLISSMTDICNGVSPAPSNKDKSNKGQLLSFLLLASIVIILILDDNRSWSFYNYLSYILISIYLFACISSYSSQYPQIGLLTFWGLVEWGILTTYNKHDTFNSFSFVMMDNKYNLVDK